MSEEKLKIINEALGRLGSSPIFALDEDTDRARTCMLVYDTEINAMFGQHRWNFAQRTVKLDRQQETPNNGWKFAFALPGERIGLPVRVLDNPRHPDHPLREFAAEGDRIYAQREEIYATFVMRVDPKNWLPMFRRCAVTALASALAMPISEDRNTKETYFVDAFGTPSEGGRGGLLGRAIDEDVRGSPGPAPAYASDPLTEARFGG
jgi:hypothetical protein